MSNCEPSLPERTNPWGWRILAGLLILTASMLHLAYLACHCPLDLAPDEAHYWDWSRHLDWSYYSKGPLVAYLIRAGCLVAESWSLELTGNAMFAVRLPAVLCGALLLLSLYVLTVQVYGQERLATAVVALALTLPIIAAGSSLMTIDAPFAACWGWALVLGHQAIFRRSAWAWPLAGLVVGIGILAKYTMVLWVPSVALFLGTSPEYRRLLFRPGFWVMSGIGALCCMPIVIWNINHDWVSLKHVGNHADQGKGFQVLGPLVFLGTQCALLLVFWFVYWLSAMWAHRPGVEANPRVRYLWWLSAPMFIFFLLFSFRNGGGEPNWPVMAYLSGLVLTAAWLQERLQTTLPRQRRLTAGGIAGACLLGLVLILLMHHSEWVLPSLEPFVEPPNPVSPLRQWDPTCRLRGWRDLASEVDRVRAEVRQREGREPVLVGTGWNLPGELAFYCEGRPRVHTVGPALGDRCSQYDFWRPNPVHDPEDFRGQTFVVVGMFGPTLLDAFGQIELPQYVFHYEGGVPVACWPVTVCHGYRGFQKMPDHLRH